MSAENTIAPTQRADDVPKGYVLVPMDRAAPKPNYDDCKHMASLATGIPAPDSAWLNIFIREINRWCIQRSHKISDASGGADDARPVASDVVKALQRIKEFVSDTQQPRWDKGRQTEISRGRILEIADAALATRDAAPRGDAQDAERYRWATELSDNAETLHSVVLCHEGDPDKINERIDSYRAASAPTEKTS